MMIRDGNDKLQGTSNKLDVLQGNRVCINHLTNVVVMKIT